jgi:TPR repeat protein
MYAEGKGVPKDMKEAFNWWSKAANQGNAAAQNNLGILYAQGSVVPKDMKEAASWWTKAANQGNAAAKENQKGMRTKKRDLFSGK